MDLAYHQNKGRLSCAALCTKYLRSGGGWKLGFSPTRFQGPWPLREVVHDMQGQEALGRRTKLGLDENHPLSGAAVICPNVNFDVTRQQAPSLHRGLGMEHYNKEDSKKSRALASPYFVLGGSR